ncbi:50S ribosomal protein L14 [Candidatus Woesearchaeota archaeon]|nr:50S ribosomal protein L14 [Candidatus Woesearchaeota archaeon]
MKALKSNVTKGLQKESRIPVCDNSGAKLIKMISVIGGKTKTGRNPSAGVSSLITASVVDGNPEMRKQVVYAIIVRQKKEYRKADGMRIRFEDNAAVVLKDEKGNPKGTMIKGAIAKEVADRWPAVSKLANILV